MIILHWGSMRSITYEFQVCTSMHRQLNEKLYQESKVMINLKWNEHCITGFQLQNSSFLLPWSTIPFSNKPRYSHKTLSDEIKKTEKPQFLLRMTFRHKKIRHSNIKNRVNEIARYRAEKNAMVTGINGQNPRKKVLPRVSKILAREIKHWH